MWGTCYKCIVLLQENVIFDPVTDSDNFATSFTYKECSQKTYKNM